MRNKNTKTHAHSVVCRRDTCFRSTKGTQALRDKKTIDQWTFFVSLCLQDPMRRTRAVWAQFCVIPCELHPSTQYAFAFDSNRIHVIFSHTKAFGHSFRYTLLFALRVKTYLHHSDCGLSLFPEICPIKGFLNDSRASIPSS